MARGSVDVDPLAVRWELYVQPLHRALSSGEEGLQGVPFYVKELLRSGAWREYRSPMGHVPRYEADQFVRFVETPMTAGLGCTVELITRLVRDDEEALDLLDQALQRAPGIHAVNNINSRPVGTSRSQALRRLRKDRPDLHARVLANELTPHAAMLEAGFRRRTITVPLEVTAAATTLRRHFTSDQLDALVKELT